MNDVIRCQKLIDLLHSDVEYQKHQAAVDDALTKRLRRELSTRRGDGICIALDMRTAFAQIRRERRLLELLNKLGNEEL